MASSAAVVDFIILIKMYNILLKYNFRLMCFLLSEVYNFFKEKSILLHQLNCTKYSKKTLVFFNSIICYNIS